MGFSEDTGATDGGVAGSAQRWQDPGRDKRSLVLCPATCEVILIAEVVVDLDQASVVKSGSADIGDVIDGGPWLRGVGAGPELE